MVKLRDEPTNTNVYLAPFPSHFLPSITFCPAFKEDVFEMHGWIRGDNPTEWWPNIGKCSLLS